MLIWTVNVDIRERLRVQYESLFSEQCNSNKKIQILIIFWIGIEYWITEANETCI